MILGCREVGGELRIGVVYLQKQRLLFYIYFHFYFQFKDKERDIIFKLFSLLEVVQVCSAVCHQLKIG
jgi:hypothetical protein